MQTSAATAAQEDAIIDAIDAMLVGDLEPLRAILLDPSMPMTPDIRSILADLMSPTSEPRLILLAEKRAAIRAREDEHEFLAVGKLTSDLIAQHRSYRAAVAKAVEATGRPAAYITRAYSEWLQIAREVQKVRRRTQAADNAAKRPPR
jgi:hypothetical protein